MSGKQRPPSSLVDYWKDSGPRDGAGRPRAATRTNARVRRRDALRHAAARGSDPPRHPPRPLVQRPAIRCARHTAATGGRGAARQPARRPPRRGATPPPHALPDGLPDPARLLTPLYGYGGVVAPLSAGRAYEPITKARIKIERAGNLRGWLCERTHGEILFCVPPFLSLFPYFHLHTSTPCENYAPFDLLFVPSLLIVWD